MKFHIFIWQYIIQSYWCFKEQWPLFQMENTHLRITQDNPSKNILNIAAETENCIFLAIFSRNVLFNFYIYFSYIFIYGASFIIFCFSFLKDFHIFSKSCLGCTED